MSLSLSAKRTVTLVTMDVLLFVEITYAFYRSFHTTGDFSETFLHCYVPVFIPTILVSFVILHWIKRKERAVAARATSPEAVLE